MIKKIFYGFSIQKNKLNYKSSKINYLAEEKLNKYFDGFSLNALQYRKIFKNLKGILNEKKKLNSLKLSLKTKNSNLNSQKNLYKEYLSQKQNFWKISKNLKMSELVNLRKKINILGIKKKINKKKNEKKYKKKLKKKKKTLTKKKKKNL